MGHFTASKYYKISDIVHKLVATKAVTKVAKLDDSKVNPVSTDVTAVEHDTTATFARSVRDFKTISDKMCTKEVVKTSEDFVDALAVVLARWTQQAEAMPKKPKADAFHSVRAPRISISDYLKRIRTYFSCSDECFVIALVYIDRMSKMNASMGVCDLTVHRLIIISMMVAAKFHDDLYYSNSHYAKVAGVGLKEVNALEAVMLKLLDWKMKVSTQEYELYHGLVYDSVYQPVEQSLVEL